MGVFMNHHIEASDPTDHLTIEHSDFAIALKSIGQPVEGFDYTKEICEFWKRNCSAAKELLPQYEKEGHGFIAEGLIREAREDYLPDIEAGRIARYLFMVSRQ